LADLVGRAEDQHRVGALVGRDRDGARGLLLLATTPPPAAATAATAAAQVAKATPPAAPAATAATEAGAAAPIAARTAAPAPAPAAATTAATAAGRRGLGQGLPLAVQVDVLGQVARVVEQPLERLLGVAGLDVHALVDEVVAALVVILDHVQRVD